MVLNQYFFPEYIAADFPHWKCYVTSKLLNECLLYWTAYTSDNDGHMWCVYWIEFSTSESDVSIHWKPMYDFHSSSERETRVWMETTSYCADSVYLIAKLYFSCGKFSLEFAFEWLSNFVESMFLCASNECLAGALTTSAAPTACTWHIRRPKTSPNNRTPLRYNMRLCDCMPTNIAYSISFLFFWPFLQRLRLLRFVWFTSNIGISKALFSVTISGRTKPI